MDNDKIVLTKIVNTSIVPTIAIFCLSVSCFITGDYSGGLGLFSASLFSYINYYYYRIIKRTEENLEELRNILLRTEKKCEKLNKEINNE